MEDSEAAREAGALDLFGIKPLIYLALVAVCLLALASIGRSCRPAPKPKPPATWSYQVDSVLNGATIIVKVGLREKRKGTLSLADIAAPIEGDRLFGESRAALEQLAGRSIKVQFSRNKFSETLEEWLESHVPECDICRSIPTRADPEPHYCAATQERLVDAFEWKEKTGVVRGETGQNLCLEQLRMGMAKNTGTSKEWRAAEAEAKKAKRGIWKE